MDIKLYVLVNSQETQNSMQTAYFKPVSEKESHQISLLAFQKMAIFSSLVDPHHYIMSTQMENTLKNGNVKHIIFKDEKGVEQKIDINDKSGKLVTLSDAEFAKVFKDNLETMDAVIPHMSKEEDQHNVSAERSINYRAGKVDMGSNKSERVDKKQKNVDLRRQEMQTLEKSAQEAASAEKARKARTDQKHERILNREEEVRAKKEI